MTSATTSGAPGFRPRSVLASPAPGGRWATVKKALAVPVGLLATAAFVGVAALMIAFLVREDALARDLRADGVATTGVVTAVTVTGGRGGLNYRLDVTYLDGLTTVDGSGCPCSLVGDQVTVVHDPHDPERAMTAGRLAGWTRWWFLPAVLLLVLPSGLVVVGWASLGGQVVAQRYRVARYGDPRVHAAERARRAGEYVAFVNEHQRRPEPTSGDVVEAGLASWWVAVQEDAPDCRETRLVADILALTRL
ncbi:hypothetical protein GXP71_12490 [Cellulomonas sp. H30R-01]|uniref:DUF3592 domain-containing protein n=1 Tax=Cellulomonas sp. H30R-01 TaxID=2704467 RepID=UPI00138CB741|nr:DUF3592 domain-containing protein [Cellulomonas sp. H30R-01]QHT56813.1 hypothetical protein GXP71_12490 [Cellulomonas sp. H30R-01]